MSDADDKKGGSKPLWLAIILILSQVLIFLSIVLPESLEKTMNHELEMMVGVYGIDDTQRIYDRSLAKSDEWLYDSGVIDSIRGKLLPPEYIEKGYVTDSSDEHVFGTPFWIKMDRAIHNVALSVEFSLLRVYSFSKWIYLLVLMFVASIASGYLFREIKKHGFEYSSPLRHGVSRRMLYMMPLLFILTSTRRLCRYFVQEFRST
jgi:hypothetical protein